MSEREPPGYDDWFDEPEPPTLESGRGGRQSYDAPPEPEEDVWTLPEDEPRRSRRPQRGGNVTVGGHELTTTQIAILVIAGLAVIIAILAAAGVFSSSAPTTTPTYSTQTTLQTTTGTTTTTPTVVAPSQPLQNGDTGAQVVLLQKALIHLSYLAPPADGSFGPATEDAVKQFQTASRLTADGYVGTETLAALKTALKTQLGG